MLVRFSAGAIRPPKKSVSKRGVAYRGWRWSWFVETCAVRSDELGELEAHTCAPAALGPDDVGGVTDALDDSAVCCEEVEDVS